MKKISCIDALITGEFISTFLYMYSIPTVNIYIMKHIDSSLLAITQILNCISVVVIATVWNKYSAKIYKRAKVILVVDCLSLICVYFYAVKSMNIIVFFVLENLVICAITRHVNCLLNKVKSNKYKNKAREKFDNSSQIATAIATLLGSALNIIYTFDIKNMLIIGCLGLVVDDITYLLVIKAENK